MAEKPANLNKTRALWELTRGQRLRYLVAAISLAIGIGFLYLSPLIVRATIDGLISKKPVSGAQHRFVNVIDSMSNHRMSRGLLFAAMLVIVVTALSAVFT